MKCTLRDRFSSSVKSEAGMVSRDAVLLTGQAMSMSSFCRRNPRRSAFEGVCPTPLTQRRHCTRVVSELTELQVLSVNDTAFAGMLPIIPPMTPFE